MRFGLPESTWQKICTVLWKYPQVERAILYGSRAKGNYKNGSDIDLSLCGSVDLSLKIIYSILEELDDLFLPYTFDLSIFKDITDPDLIEHINRVGVTVYEKGKAAPILSCLN